VHAHPVMLRGQSLLAPAWSACQKLRLLGRQARWRRWTGCACAWRAWRRRCWHAALARPPARRLLHRAQVPAARTPAAAGRPRTSPLAAQRPGRQLAVRTRASTAARSPRFWLPRGARGLARALLAQRRAVAAGRREGSRRRPNMFKGLFRPQTWHTPRKTLAELQRSCWRRGAGHAWRPTCLGLWRLALQRAAAGGQRARIDRSRCGAIGVAVCALCFMHI